MRGALVLSISLTLLAAACSDDDAVTTTAPAPTTTTTTTTTTTLPDPPAHTTTTVPPPAPPPLDTVEVAVTRVVAGFDQPVFVTGRPDDHRLFVVDQSGRLHAVSADGADRDIVLDISARVGFGGERGFLGLAFHPRDPERAFVHYSRRGDGATIIEEYLVPGPGPGQDPVRTLIQVPQPAGNHNGGMLAFGPDGMLYIALGDGGAAGDAFRHGQNPSTLLGAILRIDVDGGPGNYGIPIDNPFYGTDEGADEVWMYGLRNPWRFSFDGDDLWIADVGQGRWEEVNLVTVADGGANLGWPILEGTHCFEGPPSLCEDDDRVAPIFEYTIRGVARCAITGGYVYRGSAIPDLIGAYLFGDHCSGEVMALRVEDGGVVDHHVLHSMNERITSFGVDNDGEMYVVTAAAVYRITG